MEDSLKQPASPQARGQRIRLIREALRLSRKDVSNKYGIASGSLQNWEDARYGGLSEKGAKKLIKVFQEEGVDCQLEWLLHGVGKDPLIPDRFAKVIANNFSLSEEAVIAQELRLFHQFNEEGVDTIVSDDGVFPCYLMGDHVAGKRYFEQEMEDALETISIIQTHTGHITVRLLKPGTISGYYNLVCTNPNTKVPEPIIENIKIFSAAPILWVRRKQKAVFTV